MWSSSFSFCSPVTFVKPRPREPLLLDSRGLFYFSFFSDDRIAKPLPPQKPLREDDRAYAPIREHPDPGRHDAHMHPIAQKNRQRHPKEPHRQAGYDHGELHVSGSPESIGKDEGWHPEYGLD